MEAFLTAAEAAYGQDNPYHNSTHAADVVQAAFIMLRSVGQPQFTKLEVRIHVSKVFVKVAAGWDKRVSGEGEACEWQETSTSMQTAMAFIELASKTSSYSTRVPCPTGVWAAAGGDRA